MRGNVGKVIVPAAIQGISIREKADEILVRFIGKPIEKELRTRWGEYRNILGENYE